MMSEKSLTQKSGKSQKGMQLIFLVALAVIMVYIFYPYKQPEIVVDATPKPEVYIVVLNGCGISNVAQEVSSKLLDMKKINVKSWGNTDNPNCIHQETKIVIRQELPGQAARLAYLKEVTGIEKVITAKKDNSQCEFELILGKDYINYFKK